MNKITQLSDACMVDFNPFLTSIHILYPLRTPKSILFSCVSRGYKMGSLTRNRFKESLKVQFLDPYFFLIYINDWPENLISNPKLFADDTSFFSVIRSKHLSAQNLNEDLNKINHWAFQWKMSFNPDPSKQAQEVIFSRKLQKSVYPPLHFNNIAVTQSTTQKHLGMLLDVKLDFQGHLKNIYSKVNKTICLLRKLHDALPRLPLLTIYKSFIRPHLGYGDVIYDQAYTASFHQKIESVQYNSALAITGAIRGTSKEKLYHELGLESLGKRRWYRKLCCFYKIFRSQSSQYLFNIIPTSMRPYNTRNANNISQFKVKQFFPKFVFCFCSY